MPPGQTVEVRNWALLGANVPRIETAGIERMSFDVVAGVRSARVAGSWIERTWIERMALDVVGVERLALLIYRLLAFLSHAMLLSVTTAHAVFVV